MSKSNKSQARTLNANLYVRFLPVTDFCHDSIKLGADLKTIHVQRLQDFAKGRQLTHNETPNFWCLPSDGLFWNTSQEDVHKVVTQGLVSHLLDGSSGVVLSYGQTGTGKTLTTSGLHYQYQDRGIILRLLEDLFEEKQRRVDVQRIEYSMSYLEFYGDSLRDLLKPVQYPPLLRDKDVSRVVLGSEREGWEYVFKAETRKLMNPSSPYKGCNRGHSLVTIYVKRESLIDTDPVITKSKVHLVDLSGIDFLGDSYWKSKADLRSSNTCKTFLEQMVLCLTGRSLKTEQCPHKSNKMINYLADCLKPDCFLRFIAHINGNFKSLPLTLSSLRFGQKLRRFPACKIAKVVEPSCLLSMKFLEGEVLRLKTDLELNAMLQDSPNYANLSQEKIQQVRRAAEAFVAGELSNLTLLSLGQANLTLAVLREKYNQLLVDKDEAVKEAIRRTRDEVWMNPEILEDTSQTLAKSKSSISRKESRYRKSRRSSQSVGSVQTLEWTQSSQQLVRAPVSVVHAGESERKGISIGPGKTQSAYQGNLTRALRRSAGSKSAVPLVKTTASGSVRERGVPSIEELPEKVPNRLEAWQDFFQDMTDDVAKMQTDIDEAEDKAVLSRKQYWEMYNDVQGLRAEVVRRKGELEQLQHIRRIYGKEEVDGEGTVVPGDMEKDMLDELEQADVKLDEAIESLHLAMEELRTCAEEWAAAKNTLESSFQNYCLERYKTLTVPQDTTQVDIPSECSAADIVQENEFIEAEKAQLFISLQKAMIETVHFQPRPQWDNIF